MIDLFDTSTGALVRYIGSQREDMNNGDLFNVKKLSLTSFDLHCCRVYITQLPGKVFSPDDFENVR